MDGRSRVEALIGAPAVVSDWITLDQTQINAFADLTGDWQFIHVDPVRAARTAFGGTVAHGFLTLSMLSQMFKSCMLALPPLREAVNYGFDRVRFVAPVPAGARIRGHFAIAGAESRSDGRLLLRIKAEIQTEGASRPAVLADWLVLMTFAD